MKSPTWIDPDRLLPWLVIAGLCGTFPLEAKASKAVVNHPTPQPISCPEPANPDPLLGPRTKIPGRWIGRTKAAATLSIVVMAGHADSQGTGSSGTPGYAVDQRRQPPMQVGIRDELFWNRQVQAAVVRLGKSQGLNIRSYTPPAITIVDDDNPGTNWSRAKAWSARGEYILEIHFDAYSPHGFGSGLIPAINRPLNSVDESLGQAFGRFPRNFRGGLGGPRRGIGILEMAMLEPPLEDKLRDQATRSETVYCLAKRVVEALVKGVS
tara:strand:+ start:58 stop:858 length:801 start_codon:yes stop_codon:yes gene_type:complete